MSYSFSGKIFRRLKRTARAKSVQVIAANISVLSGTNGGRQIDLLATLRKNLNRTIF